MQTRLHKPSDFAHEVGLFYNIVGHKLAGGSRVAKLSQNGSDIIHPGLNTEFEVKAVNTTHQHLADVEPLEHYLSKAQRGKYYIFILFRYRRPGKSHRGSFRKIATTPQAVRRYLAHNTLGCYVIDSALVRALLEHKEIVRRIHNHEQVDALKIPYALLVNLGKRVEWKNALENLSLKASRFKRHQRRMQIKVRGRKLSFPMTAVVQRHIAPKLFAQLFHHNGVH